MLDRIEFLISEAVSAMRRNTWMTFSAVSTCAMALFLLGGIAYVYATVDRYAQTLPGRFEVRVFLQEGASPAEISAAAAQIRAIDGVASAHWIPREQAWRKMRAQMPAQTEGLENPLPDGFNIRLEDLERADAVVARLRALPFVPPDGVSYLHEERQVIAHLLTLLRWLGAGLGGLMLMTAGVLIYNAIRLTIVARRREMRIMHLVGANRATIVTPLLIEGVLQGALGGALAGVLIGSAHAGVTWVMQTHTAFGQAAPYPWLHYSAFMALTGAIYGLVCSGLAVRDPNRLR
jgi:cell division transport system permease protein